MYRLSKLISFFTKNTLLQGSFWLTVGGIFANFGNYIFNLVMGRLLTPAEYGTIASLVSLSIIVSLPSSLITLITTKFVAEFNAKKETDKVAKVIKKLTLYTSIAGLVLFVGFLLGGDYLQQYLNISDKRLLVLTAFIIVIGLISSVQQGVYRGFLYFKWLTILNFATVLLKIVIGWYLIAAGYSVYGVLLALLISSLIPWLLSLWPLRFYFVHKSAASQGLRKLILSFSLPSFFITAASTLFMSTDLILVKHYFSETDAGVFAAASLMGKAIYYAIAPVSTVLFSVIVQQYAKKEKLMEEFRLSLLLTAIPGILAVLVYFLVPEIIVYMFFPHAGYSGATSLIGLYGLNMFMYSLVFLFMNFFLGIEKHTLSFLSLLAAVVQITGILLFHDSLIEILYVSLVVSTILLTVYIVSYVRVMRQGS